MTFHRIRSVWLFALLFCLSPGLRAGSAKARLAGNYGSYNFFDESSYAIAANFSFDESQSWGIRAAALGINKYAIGAFQGAMGATYHIVPIWSFDLDLDAATVGSILPRFSLNAKTSVTISDSATPSFSYNYTYYEDAQIHTITPGFSWSIIPQLSLGCKLNGALSRFVNGKTSGNISGTAEVGYAPFDYFSMSLGYGVGEQPFDPGEPGMPLSSYFAHTLFGGFKFDMEGHIGAQVNIEKEWRNNSQEVLNAQLATYYQW